MSIFITQLQANKKINQSWNGFLNMKVVQNELTNIQKSIGNNFTPSSHLVVRFLQNDLNKSEKLLKKSWILDSCNFNSMFNIAYLKELKGDFEEAKRFYIRIIDNCTDIEVVEEAKSKINLL